MILAGCVVGYFAVNGILTAMDYFITKTSVMSFNIGEDTVFLDLTLPPFSDQLTVALRSGKKTVSKDLSVGAYFDSDGILHQEPVFRISWVSSINTKPRTRARTARRTSELQRLVRSSAIANSVCCRCAVELQVVRAGICGTCAHRVGKS